MFTDFTVVCVYAGHAFVSHRDGKEHPRTFRTCILAFALYSAHNGYYDEVYCKFSCNLIIFQLYDCCCMNQGVFSGYISC